MTQEQKHLNELDELCKKFLQDLDKELDAIRQRAVKYISEEYSVTEEQAEKIIDEIQADESLRFPGIDYKIEEL